jgi:hypothetical protein
VPVEIPGHCTGKRCDRSGGEPRLRLRRHRLVERKSVATWVSEAVSRLRMTTWPEASAEAPLQAEPPSKRLTSFCVRLE